MSSLKFERDSAHSMGLIAVPRLAPSAMHWRFCDFSILGFAKVSLNLFSFFPMFLLPFARAYWHGSSRPTVCISWSPSPLYFVHPSSSFDTRFCRPSWSRYSTSGTVLCRPRRKPQLWAAIRHSRLDCHPSDGRCSCSGNWDVNPDSYSGRTVDMLSTKCELSSCLTLKNAGVSFLVRNTIQTSHTMFVFLVNTDR